MDEFFGKYSFYSWGMMIAAARYAIIPTPVQPKNAQISRMMVGSMPKNSPMPPQTPLII